MDNPIAKFNSRILDTFWTKHLPATALSRRFSVLS